jgi:hypothetical protein
VKRRDYTSRGEKQSDFFIGFFAMAAILLLLPMLLNAVSGGFSGTTGAGVLVLAAVGFLIGAGVYRRWMAIGALGCLGTLLALGLLAALFVAVVCSSAFR